MIFWRKNLTNCEKIKNANGNFITCESINIKNELKLYS